MAAQDLLNLICGRRSRRVYAGREVEPELVEMILEAGRWAPSGTNNQPWRFVVARRADVKDRLAEFTKYGRIIRSASVVIPVFIHRPSMYHQVKDSQAVGACLQNMLLMAHGLGLAAVWLGEILAQAEAVRLALGVSEEHELMAVMALGWPAKEALQGKRKPLEDLVLDRLE